jgi:hypothetical protein
MDSFMKTNLRAPRLHLLLGVTVLLGCAVSVTAFQRSSRAKDKELWDGRPATAASRPQGVICLGDVDLEHGVTALSVLQPGRVLALLVHENDTCNKQSGGT